MSLTRSQVGDRPTTGSYGPVIPFYDRHEGVAGRELGGASHVEGRHRARNLRLLVRAQRVMNWGLSDDNETLDRQLSAERRLGRTGRTMTTDRTPQADSP